MEYNQTNVPSGSQGPSPFQQGWYQQVPQGSSQYIPTTNVLHPGPNNFQPINTSYQCPPGWFQQFATNVPSASGPQQFPQAYASNETDEAELYECIDPPVPSTTARRKKKVTSKVMLGNFSPDEDINLVKSWLEISTDPITNTGQKKEKMWERIQQRYDTRRGSYDERSVRSLQSRWDSIKTEVGKFCGYYADTVRENASGTTDADKTTIAAAEYATMQKRSFAYMHCWELMKDEPKWQDPKTKASARSAAGEGFGEDSHHGEDRPMGRDAAKAAKKSANSSGGSSASAEYAARQQEIRQRRLTIMEEDAEAKKSRFEQQASYNMSLLTIEQEKMQMMREKYETDKRDKEKQEDERILAIDLDKCLPSQRMYYQMAQEDIVEREAARRRARQAP